MKNNGPPIKTVYYEDESKDEFSSAVITPKTIDETWQYLQKGFSWQVKRFVSYRLFAPIIGYFYCRIRLGWRLKNKSVLKGLRNKKQGYFVYGNHTQQTADAFIPSFVSFPKSTYVIVHANNVSMPYLGRITPYLGALPLPDTLRAARNFKRAVHTRYQQGSAVFIYPEAHIWPYYTRIRNFPAASFRYPVDLDAPSFCVTTTYQRRKFWKTPRAVTYVDGPFYPDKTLPIKERVQTLRDEIYAKMQERSKLSTCEYIRYERKGEAK